MTFFEQRMVITSFIKPFVIVTADFTSFELVAAFE
jgi:hypothetical protein